VGKKTSQDNVKEVDNLEELGLDEGIILKWIKKQGRNGWRDVLFRIGTNGGLM
jgi:hypothetical protein